MEEETKEKLTSRTTWLRLFFMLIFGLLVVVALYVAAAVALIQFGFVLFTGERSERLSTFANQLAQYINQCVRFIVFDSEDQPFPFDDWPKASVKEVTDESADDYQI